MNINDFLLQVKNFIGNNMLNYTTVFGIVYIVAIFLNGLEPKYSCDTNAIIMGYAAIAGKGLVNHTINSTLNSDKGSMPTVDRGGK